MSDAREYIEPVTIDRESVDTDKGVDNDGSLGVETHDTTDPRAAIAEKHAQKQRSELGIEELTPVVAANPEMVLVKVNGKERQVPKSRVEEAGGIDVYQKRLAAEDKLQEASLQRKALEQQQNELQNKVAEFQNWQQQQIAKLAQERNALAQAGHSKPSAPPPANAKEQRELANRYHTALINGEDDLAADLLLQIQDRNRPNINVDEIEQRAINRFQQIQRKQAWDAEHSAALTEFRDKFADVMANPRLVDVADQYTIQLQRDPNLSPRQILQAAGEYARQYRDEIAGVRQGDGVSVARSEAKRAMSVARAATGRNPTPIVKTASPSDYIESLKAARGQI